MPGEVCFAFVDAQLACAACAELVLGKHAEDGFANDFFRARLHQAANGNFFEPAGEAAVMAINFLVDLVAGEADALGIDDDDVVAAIEMRGEIGLVLTDQQAGDACREATEHLSIGIDDEPILTKREVFDIPPFGHIRPHCVSHTFPSRDKR